MNSKYSAAIRENFTNGVSKGEMRSSPLWSPARIYASPVTKLDS